MSNLEDAVEPFEIIKNLSKKVLAEVYAHERSDDDDSEKTPTKSEMIRTLQDAVETTGTKELIKTIRRNDLKKVCEKYREELGFKQDENLNSRQVLTKRLVEKIGKVGIDEFLKDYVETDILNKICDDLDIDNEDASDRDDLVKQISTFIRALGSFGFWDSFSADLLTTVANDLELKGKNTKSKKRLVDAIITNTKIEKAHQPKKKKITVSKKKKPIEKGITFDDIFQHYYAGEVKDWCKSHGLKTSGKKTDLIKRILDFLDGGKEGLATKASLSRKRKNEGKESKSKTKKQKKQESSDSD
eukprot:TRINITY_DN8245_c0_g1_i2.p1 TRINITY_DN8245_c0_g1~~TRINITY_DN8245_c0_g1_i2.p1  ORF type:complete len:322 (+),score=71.23 TRINITY_DN8245_c0_g1_i2:66-968(+)